MAKVSTKEVDMIEEAVAFEMIELSCDELDSLTRAFNMISEVCKELQSDDTPVTVKPAKIEMH